MVVRRLPPLRSLEAFVRVIRVGSAKQAAAELALSPSALSRRVAQLEDYVGKPLFLRQHQQLKLNEAGQAFYDAVAPALDELAERVNAQLDESRVLRMRLGVLPLFGSQRLFPRLPELRRLHPTLHIDIDSSPQAEARVGDAVDAAIIITRAPDPTLLSFRLDHNLVYAIASKDLAAQLGPEPSLEALNRQTFLVHEEMEESFTAWKTALGLEHLRPQAVDRYNSGALILEAAAQGLGIAIMHDDHMARSHDDRLALLFDREIESPYSYWFVCRPRALENRAVRMFHDWLVKAQL